MSNLPPSALPEQLIYLIIRFTASIPDLELPISSPRTTTTLSLKQLIRSHLPSPHASARLRLIYAGKVLADSAALSTSLRLPTFPPPPRDGTYNEHGAGSSGSKSKGKQPIRDPPTTPSPPQDTKRYYIHCSLGDALSASDLASEAAQAAASSVTLAAKYQPSSSTTGHSTASHGAGISEDANAATHRRRRSSTTSSTAPQGFDRLLSSGFTPAEVATLRSQFQQNLSFTHTPDTMPSPHELRALEDRWLDSTANDPSSALTGADTVGAGAADAGWGAGFSAEEGGLDDMLWGYLVGFFWGAPALIWGFREEGVWSRRRQVAVVMGGVINLAFGFMRWNS